MSSSENDKTASATNSLTDNGTEDNMQSSNSLVSCFSKGSCTYIHTYKYICMHVHTYILTLCHQSYRPMRAPTFVNSSSISSLPCKNFSAHEIFNTTTDCKDYPSHHFLRISNNNNAAVAVKVFAFCIVIIT